MVAPLHPTAFKPIESEPRKAKFFSAKYRMTRSGVSCDPWRGHVVSFTGTDEPVVKGLNDSTLAGALAWELNLRHNIDIPKSALQYGLLPTYFLIKDKGRIEAALGALEGFMSSKPELETPICSG